MAKNFYITTPIYYASGRLHLGSASSTCFCDSYKRYKKQMGYDTRFMTGLDEHGQKVEKKAEEKGLSPQEYTDKLADRAKSLWSYLKCDYDYFIRTTDENHMKQVWVEVFLRRDLFKTTARSAGWSLWQRSYRLTSLWRRQIQDALLKTCTIHPGGISPPKT